MSKQKRTYESALSELQDIVSDIHNEKIPLENLAERVKKAKELIQFCRNKLRGLEDDLKEFEI